MTDIKQFPHASLVVVERQLADLLHSYVRLKIVPRCCLAFVREDSIYVPRDLVTDPSWKLLFAATDQGLIGSALRSSDAVTWKDGEDKPFHRGDERTVFEIGVGITHQGCATGVLLIDYFDGESTPDLVQDAEIYRLRDEIQEAMNSQEKEEQKLRAQIDHLTLKCLNDTQSLRGYTAIKKWDGTLVYFTVGDQGDSFRRIGQLDGICGEVFRHGVFQNAPDVWQHPSYLASDNRIKSEAVAPIVVGDAPIGVLNMESDRGHNYNDEFVEKMQHFATTLSAFADRYRKTVTPDIGFHSFLLSDMIEQFSAPTHRFAEDSAIRHWALDLLASRVRHLEGVSAVDFVERREPFGDEDTLTAASHDAPPDYRVDTDAAGATTCEYDVRVYGAVKPTLRVTFETRPGRATLEVISQLCRLTVNELRRRIRERRYTEFEHLVDDIAKSTHENLLTEIPLRLQKMFNCDHVTLFLATDFLGRQILTPWSTTAESIVFTDDEHFYHVSEEDGLTGYAATQTDVVLIKNVSDGNELARVHPKLVWKHKSQEDDYDAVRSFFGVPVRIGGRLRALIRGHRSKHFRHLPLSDADRDRLRRVQFLLQIALDESAIDEALATGAGATPR